jgi:hypothetical protein
MGKFYTQHDINKFLSNFRKLPDPYKLEKVHQLLNDPYALARHRIKLNHKPFNLIIMTTVFIVGLTAILFWSGPGKTEISKPESFKNTEVVSITAPVKISHSKMSENFSAKSEKLSAKSEIESEPLRNNTLAPALIEKNEPESSVLIGSYRSCTWSPDTTIDKKTLLLNLTDPELKEIGITKRGDAIFYHNIIPGQYDMGIVSEQIPMEERITTYYKFYVAFVTNFQFEPEGSGNFYSSMDTLVPVTINDKQGRIFWFTPDKSLFRLLPPRYGFLESVYENLKCLKKKYPEKSFTNFIEAGTEKILDPIKVLDLDNESLQGIGVIIEKESLTFQSKNRKYSLEISKTGTNSTGNDEDMYLFPPNPYPVLMTDTLGRRLYTTNTTGNADSLTKIMNILVPVRIRVNKIVPSRHEVIICWYYPTPEFIKALPSKTGKELSSELLIIKNDTKGASSSCNYFEVCKSSIRLDKFKLYPNPARQTVNVEFDNTEEIIGSISIVNMAGIKLRELQSKTTFSTGHNYFQMDLSGISPGMYLISVNTVKGFKTQRLIVSR